MKDITKKYTNGEVTVVWKPNVCIHSTICWKNMRNVFDPTKRPWIDMEANSTDKIVEQIKQCPSGALSYYMNNEVEEKVAVDVESLVEVTPNGPLLVYGNITVKDHTGKVTKHNKVTALCRCGASSNKPFCDGTHKKIDFKG